MLFIISFIFFYVKEALPFSLRQSQGIIKFTFLEIESELKMLDINHGESSVSVPELYSTVLFPISLCSIRENIDFLAPNIRYFDNSFTGDIFPVTHYRESMQI